MSAESAKAILMSRCLKCRSPLNFNDPFDVQVGFHLGFDINDLGNMVTNKIKELVEAKYEPYFENKNDFSEVIKYLRINHNYKKFKENEFNLMVHKIVETSVEILEKNRTDFIEIRKKTVKSMRVVCLAEEFDNLLMWSHYSDFHRGVVMRLSVSEFEKDNDPLWLAKKVKYINRPEPLFTGTQILNFIFGIKSNDIEKLKFQLVYTKYEAWKYEKEWRFWTTVDDGNDEDYLMTFPCERFDGLFFGCKCKNDDIIELKNIGMGVNSKMKFYKAEQENSEFKLRMNEI